MKPRKNNHRRRPRPPPLPLLLVVQVLGRDGPSVLAHVGEAVGRFGETEGAMADWRTHIDGVARRPLDAGAGTRADALRRRPGGLQRGERPEGGAVSDNTHTQTLSHTRTHSHLSAHAHTQARYIFFMYLLLLSFPYTQTFRQLDERDSKTL